MNPEYLFPNTVKEAVKMLGCCPGEGRVMAGGTDLMLQVKEGKVAARIIVDITRLPELRGIRKMANGFIWIGAATTHRQAWESPLVRAQAGVLAEACRKVGALQIQNAGTLGGNVVNAMPAADASIALVALGAEAQIATKSGRRWVKLESVFTGPGRCSINPCSDLLVGFRCKSLGKRAGSALQRMARRRALALPMLNCAAVVQLDAAGKRVKRATVAIGPVAPVPLRARQAEKMLAGARVTEELWHAAAELAAEDANPRPSLLRGPTEYRKKMVVVMVRRALAAAAAQARKK